MGFDAEEIFEEFAENCGLQIAKPVRERQPLWVDTQEYRDLTRLESNARSRRFYAEHKLNINALNKLKRVTDPETAAKWRAYNAKYQQGKGKQTRRAYLMRPDVRERKRARDRAYRRSAAGKLAAAKATARYIAKIGVEAYKERLRGYQRAEYQRNREKKLARARERAKLESVRIKLRAAQKKHAQTEKRKKANLAAQLRYLKTPRGRERARQWQAKYHKTEAYKAKKRGYDKAYKERKRLAQLSNNRSTY